MKAIEWLTLYNYGLCSTERPGSIASNSQLKRWFNTKSVKMNGRSPSYNQQMGDVLYQLVLFPKGKRKSTIVKIDQLMIGDYIVNLDDQLIIKFEA